MLTRLKVSGFKNLVDVDVRFGPFTCIAGANGVGKSNLFDAIRFLSALADQSLLEAALSVRDEQGRTADVRSLFHRVGDDYATEMSFEAEMIVPHEGLDNLGQKATASITFLRYTLALAYRQEERRTTPGPLEIVKEELAHIKIGDAHKHLLFPHSATAWRKSAVRGERRVRFFVSTEGDEESRVIKLHQDKVGGRPFPRSATNLPKTVLSSVTAAESPTAALAQREMRSWRLLQLEPSSLRRPDEFTAPTRIGADGSHLPATLYHLARLRPSDEEDPTPEQERAEQVYSEVANRLSNLIDDVRDVTVHRDERRELFTLMVTGSDGTPHPARALSDGTLRFLALSVLALDPQAQGVLCLEEPENGIHPERIPAMLQLLEDIATDTDEEVGPDNPLRQVIINTHSPAVVAQVPDDSLLVAELKERVQDGQRFQHVHFSPLPDTWRAKDGADTAPKGRLLSYLHPVPLQPAGSLPGTDGVQTNGTRTKQRRVVDREDLQLLLPGLTIGRK